jgi:hypothetical protein
MLRSARRWPWLVAASTLVLTTGAAFAQTPPPPPPAPTVPPPKAPGTSASLPDLGPPAALPEGAPPQLAKIDRHGLREHAYWLADDARQGRYTTSAGQKATAKYVADHFQRVGLKPLGDKKGFLQSYPLTRTWLDQASVQVGPHKFDRDLAVLPAAKEHKVALGGRLVYCGNGSREQVPAGLAGKVPVVVLPPTSGSGGAGNDLQAVQRYLDIAEQLAAQGATAGLVLLLNDNSSLANTLNYRALLPDHPQLRFGAGGGERGLGLRVPLLVLSTAQSKLVVEYLALPLDDQGKPTGPPQNEKATGKLGFTVKHDDKGTGSNVVAVLHGSSQKAEAIVFSAHHDHVGRRLDGDAFNGADDNASGTAGLLELAEAFASGPKPARTLIFLSVSGEELGLWGSEWYGDHPTWPRDQIIANVNIDMIGRAIATGDGGRAMQVTPSHQHEKYSTLVQNGVQLGRHFGLTFGSGDTYYHRSDHYNFAKHGIPVVFFCDGEHPDYHQVTDTADRLDYVGMEAIARLAGWCGWLAAQAQERPRELGPQPGW